MYKLELEEAKKQLLELVEAAINGEEVLIVKDDQQIVRLVPVPPSASPTQGKRMFGSAKGRPQFGSAKGMITMSEDFDEPLEDFKEYM